ncbi:Cyanidin-3-O-glucoside 2-O-glucuronosyltransferase [Artemisia annua]|uniref:Cyanidin-3-O-glucoside 2-O-glucuronosyltransferase n=1 Tax=Artemisia annua TaxID=35608 RepID=A0A2U1M3R7_ARTAN|nr:Cyanidin-3-O-glucoside 2-O-glucuronosyltransferase [Artemisia annua]
MDSANKSNNNDRYRIILLPWLAYSHISRFLAFAKGLAKHSYLDIYLCSSQINLQIIKKNLPDKYSKSITLVELNLPSTTSLPLHYHTTKGLPPHLLKTLTADYAKSGPDFEVIIQSIRPHLLIYDFSQLWAIDAATSMNVPSVMFLSGCVSLYSMAAHFAIRPSGEKYPFPEMYFKDHEIAHMKAIGKYIPPMEEIDTTSHPFFECMNRSRDIILVKSTRELAGKYIDYMSEIVGKKVLPVGPLVEENSKEDVNEHVELFQWLDNKQDSSVVFVSFGSEYFLSENDIEDIAYGLELSQLAFLDSPLKVLFPRVYALDRNKQCAVAQRLNCSDWSVDFRRMPRGGAEESQFTALLEAIRDVRLSDASDGWIWGLDHSGFSVASARKYIDEQVLTGGYTSTRWPRCVPIKVNVFMWRLGLNKLPTLVNMDRFTMSQVPYTELCDVDPMLDDITVIARCISTWHSHAKGKPNEPWSLDGNRIQATIKRDAMSKFAGLLEEGACYRIRNFGVGENGGKYPLLPHKYKINFFKNTSLTRINRFDTNHNGFKFKPFLRFSTRRWTEEEAVDVIGTIVSIGNPKPFGSGQKLRTVILEDAESQQLQCTFFDNWSDMFNDITDNRESIGHVVIVLQLAKVKYWNVIFAIVAK